MSAALTPMLSSERRAARWSPKSWIIVHSRNLLQQPTKVFDRLIVVREDPHRVLDRHRADALQPAPHLHPEVIGLRRDLVEQQEPTSGRCAFGHQTGAGARCGFQV